MSLVFVPVIIIFSCGIIYIVNAIRGIPLTYTKKERGEYDCISNYFWGALMVLFMLALLIDAPDYFSGKCKDGKAVVLKDLSSRRSGSFDLKFEDGEIVRVSTIFQRAAVGENIDATVLPSTKFAFIHSPNYLGIGVAEAFSVIALIGCCSVWSAHKRRKRTQNVAKLFCMSTKPTSSIAANRFWVSVLIASCSIIFPIWIVKNAAVWKSVVFCIVSAAASAVSVQQITVSVKEREYVKNHSAPKHSKEKEDWSIGSILERIRQEDILEVTAYVDGKKVKFGACSDYSEENGFFDKGYFIRKQTYDDYALFCSELDKLLSNRDVVIKRVE